MILFDLGVSSMQIDAWERGFSYAFDAPLDMRMDPDAELTAAEIVNEWPETPASPRPSATTARSATPARSPAEIVAARPLETTSELVEAVRAGVPPKVRFGRGNPAKRTFQAIRIAVNGELDAIDAALPQAWDLLAPGGRLAAIAFHSLEDRRVKRFLVDRARGCVCPPEFPVCRCGHEPEAELITRGASHRAPARSRDNPRSASAHLRVARKLETDRRRVLMGAAATSTATSPATKPRRPQAAPRPSRGRRRSGRARRRPPLAAARLPPPSSDPLPPAPVARRSIASPAPRRRRRARRLR